MGWGHKASEEDLPLQSVEEETDNSLGYKEQRTGFGEKTPGKSFPMP